MKNTPTPEQIENAKTWTELLAALGINPRNDREGQKIKAYVRSLGPTHLDRRQRYKIDDETFKTVVKESISIRDALKRLDLNAVGAAYLVFHKRVKMLEIDTSHFLGQGANKGKISPQSKTVDHYLVKDGPHINTYRLKNKLFDADLKARKCEKCGTTHWLGEPAPLQLDHINGDNRDNRLSNLRILCAMCHALTPTFAGRNKGKRGGRGRT